MLALSFVNFFVGLLLVLLICLNPISYWYLIVICLSSFFIGYHGGACGLIFEYIKSLINSFVLFFKR